MDLPVFLATDQNGFFLVVEHKNHRIIQLKASLEFIREYIPESGGLDGPSQIHLLESRLYIAESTERNIKIFDL